MNTKNPGLSPTVDVSVGVAFNVLGSVLFAVMYGYTSLLVELSSGEIYGWRILLTAPCLTLMILAMGRWNEVSTIFQRMRHERRFWGKRLISASLLGVQLWLFMWAPINGYGLDVSLGYFLLPLSMVILGRVAFGERLSGFQLVACLLAAVGIVNQIVIAQAITWPVLAVCLGYPGYFWLRRVTNTNTLGGLWFDMNLSLPLSLFFIWQGGQVIEAGTESMHLWWLVLGLGVISAAALGCQALSAPRMNLTLFGLLIYVEPVLLVFVSIWLGEAISDAQWPTYIAIWLAVLVLMAEGARTLLKVNKKSLRR
jgi:chloramphenicol-sensitive protein RarD